MGGSSDRSVYEGETPHKPSHAIARKSEKSPSEKSLPRKKVEEYIATSDGNPVAALAHQAGSHSESTSDRRARLDREVEASLAKLNRSS